MTRHSTGVQNAPVNQALNDGHLRLLELLLRVTASRVGEVDGMADLDVVREGDVLDLDTVQTKARKSRILLSDSAGGALRF